MSPRRGQRGHRDTPARAPGPPRALSGAATRRGQRRGNGTRASSGVPARYWSPVIFVVLALLVLFVTYHRTRDRGIRDQVTSGSDSSDLGALVQPHDPDPVPKIPSLQENAPKWVPMGGAKGLGGMGGEIPKIRPQNVGKCFGKFPKKWKMLAAAGGGVEIPPRKFPPPQKNFPH
ncbi:uncharacterized protein M8220_014046 [Acridotheres tristis]